MVNILLQLWDKTQLDKSEKDLFSWQTNLCKKQLQYIDANKILKYMY